MISILGSSSLLFEALQVLIYTELCLELHREMAIWLSRPACSSRINMRDQDCLLNDTSSCAQGNVSKTSPFPLLVLNLGDAFHLFLVGNRSSVAQVMMNTEQIKFWVFHFLSMLNDSTPKQMVVTGGRRVLVSSHLFER